MPQGNRRGQALLLHAAGSGPRALAAFAAGLEAELGCASALPLPLAGATSAGDPLAPQITAVRRAIDAAQPDQPIVLVGHSLGGLVALLAMLDGAAVAAAILYEPIVLACLDEADPGDRAARAWDRALIEGIAAGVSAGHPEPAVARFIEAYNEVAWSELPGKARAAILADAQGLQATTQAVHVRPLSATTLASLTTPVLVLSGTRSPDVAQRMARRLTTKLANASHAIVEGAGHMGPVLAPDAVLAALRPFLPRLA